MLHSDDPSPGLKTPPTGNFGTERPFFGPQNGLFLGLGKGLQKGLWTVKNPFLVSACFYCLSGVSVICVLNQEREHQPRVGRKAAFCAPEFQIFLTGRA